MNLDDLAFQLNEHAGATNAASAASAGSTTFDAVVTEDGIVEVLCSNNDEFPIHLTRTETQLLSVTPLFTVAEVADGKVDELNATLLRLSPAIPLSSIGLQGDTYILFGAMALGTRFEVIAHELEVQAENTIDVLEAVESLLA